MVHVRRQVFLALALLVVAASGCNVYEGLYEEGQSDNPEVLLEDARIAMQQDRPAEAVAHLRKALDNTPKDDLPLRNKIQIKLASAVLHAEAINVLSLKRLVRTFGGFSSTAALGKTHSQTCIFPESHAREGFDPAEGIDLERLGSPTSQAVLDESLKLVARVFSGQETTSNPTFPCDDAALDHAIADLQAQGLTNEEIAEALVDFSVAKSTVSYLDVISAGGDDASFFYVTPPAGHDYIGLCFTSEQTCTSTIAQTTANLAGIDCATRVLQKRAALLGSFAAQELADLAHNGFQTMSAGLSNATCIVY